MIMLRENHEIGRQSSLRNMAALGVTYMRFTRKVRVSGGSSVTFEGELVLDVRGVRVCRLNGSSTLDTAHTKPKRSVVFLKGRY